MTYGFTPSTIHLFISFCYQWLCMSIQTSQIFSCTSSDIRTNSLPVFSTLLLLSTALFMLPSITIVCSLLDSPVLIFLKPAWKLQKYFFPPFPDLFLSVVSKTIQRMNPGDKFPINPGDNIRIDEIFFPAHSPNNSLKVSQSINF